MKTQPPRRPTTTPTTSVRQQAEASPTEPARDASPTRSSWVNQAKVGTWAAQATDKNDAAAATIGEGVALVTLALAPTVAGAMVAVVVGFAAKAFAANRSAKVSESEVRDLYAQLNNVASREHPGVVLPANVRAEMRTILQNLLLGQVQTERGLVAVNLTDDAKKYVHTKLAEL